MSARCSGETEALLKLQDKLASAGFAAMVLLPVMDVAIPFVACRAAPWAILSSDHDQRIDLRGGASLGNFSLNRCRALHGTHYRNHNVINEGQKMTLGLI